MTATICTIRHRCHQVRDALAERIATGAWKPGVAIPNESDLARAFGVSAGTMRKALRLLESELLIIRRPRRAPLVKDESFAHFKGVRRGHREPLKGNVAPVETTEGVADEKERWKLRLQIGDKVYRTHGIRLNNDRAFIYEERSIPSDALSTAQGHEQPLAPHCLPCTRTRYSARHGGGTHFYWRGSSLCSRRAWDRFEFTSCRVGSCRADNRRTCR